MGGARGRKKPCGGSLQPSVSFTRMCSSPNSPWPLLLSASIPAVSSTWFYLANPISPSKLPLKASPSGKPLLTQTLSLHSPAVTRKFTLTPSSHHSASVELHIVIVYLSAHVSCRAVSSSRRATELFNFSSQYLPQCLA